MVQGDHLARTRVVEIDASDFPFYESDDLDIFQGVVEDVLAELRREAAPLDEAALKIRVAALLFKCAEDGERDAAVLKRRTLEALVAGYGGGQ